MENAERISTENLEIHALLDRYLASRSTLKSSAAETSAHLDNDALSTFVEGALSQRELAPVVTHLVECGFCLHKSAELVRLELELADVIGPAHSVESQEPEPISAVLSKLFSRIFGTSDAAVFAHEEKEDSQDASNEEKSADDY
jgi:hypothetical protein